MADKRYYIGDFCVSNKNKNMNKEIKITPPEGYEVDKEHSTFECIKFKPLSPKLNVITKGKRFTGDWNINGKWAFSMFMTEDEGNRYQGKIESGHRSSLYLDSSNGIWYNEKGQQIYGYLFYKPKNICGDE